MKTELRYASHPADVKGCDTEKLRKEFLMEKIFIPDKIVLVYTIYDRYIVGGVMPASGSFERGPIDELKADYFLERREAGIINTGGKAGIRADSDTNILGNKEALYLGDSEIRYPDTPK